MARWLPAPLKRVEADLERWRQVAAGADAFFARVAGLHRDRMQCRSGCTECCQPGLTVVRVEALAVLLGLSRLEEQALAPLSRAVTDTSRSRCPLLTPDDTCAIYPLRPLICRTHGLPVLQETEVSVCPLNFQDGFPDGAVLDGGLLATQLGLVNTLLGGASSQRVAIADLLTRGAAALTG